MKRVLLILLLIFPLSCYDGLSDMLDDVTMKVPICVDATGGDDGNDGRGWRNAFQTLQAAVAAAEDGDEIWVAEGNYTVTTSMILQPVSIYGGFKGSESRRDQRNPDINTTELTGAGTIFDIKENAVIDGITFTGSGNSALFIAQQANIKIKNCIFNNNLSNSNGGAISIDDSSTVEIFKSVFTANTSTVNGGAISVNGSDLIIKECIFGDKDDVNKKNQAPSGGAIYAFGGSTVTISDNCEFYRNEATGSGATNGGGAIYVENSSLIVKASSFGNSNVSASGNVGASGGAIYARDLSVVTISDNTQFYRNIAAPTSFEGGGGAISINSSTLTISRAIFGNAVIEDSGNKNVGAMGTGGAIKADSASTVTMSDNTQFYRNSSVTQGGAIYLKASTLEITNSTLGGDSAESGNKSINSAGGAIYAMNNCDITLTGTKIKYNSSSGSGGGVHASGGKLDIENKTYLANNVSGLNGGGIFSEQGEVNISDSYIQNNSSGGAGGGIRLTRSRGIISNSEISGNVSSADVGGGISFTTFDAGHYLEIIDSLIKMNEAANDGGGVALSATSSGTNPYLYIERSRFISNRAGAASNGGGVFLGQYVGRSTFVNSYFYNNQANQGGALYIRVRNDHDLVNLNFFENTATQGGAIYFYVNEINVYNSVFYLNIGDNVYSSSGNYYNLYNCFFNNGMKTWEGDLHESRMYSPIRSSLNPFISTTPAASNFLYPNSLIVDKGLHPVPGFTMPATDLAGRTRIVGGVNKIDIGAYERQ